MSTLFDRTIAESYTELLKTSATDGVSSSLTVVEDGDATASALQISTLMVRSSGNLEVAGTSTLTGNVSLGGELTVTGTAVFQGDLTANGGTLTLGNADTDNVVFNSRIASHIVPSTTNAYDLGSASREWGNLFIDGVANIDSLVADTAAVSGGTINNTSIGATTPSSAVFTTATVTSATLTTATVNGGTINNTTLGATTPASAVFTTVAVNNTTQSTTKDNGALVVEGGVGVEKNVNIGGNVVITGNLQVAGTTTIFDPTAAPSNVYWDL